MHAHAMRMSAAARTRARHAQKAGFTVDVGAGRIPPLSALALLEVALCSRQAAARLPG